MEDIQTSHYLIGLLPTLASDCSVSSAGVGRTGTYIVLDWSLHAIREKDELNIFQIVCTLREHRVLMVQTEVSEKHRLPATDYPVIVPVGLASFCGAHVTNTLHSVAAHIHALDWQSIYLDLSRYCRHIVTMSLLFHHPYHSHIIPYIWHVVILLPYHCHATTISSQYRCNITTILPQCHRNVIAAFLPHHCHFRVDQHFRRSIHQRACYLSTIIIYVALCAYLFTYQPSQAALSEVGVAFV